MNAKELRIGNWLRHKGLGDHVKVCCITDRKTFEGSASFFYYDEFEPIKLTEEWLIKLGFELNIENDSFFKDCFSVSCGDSGCLFFYSGDYEKLHELTEFKSVHQLQNLYFALTGEELKLNKNESNI